uniref:Putative cop9 signalosome subunit csn8 n=1 Tax=Rhipicephalus microplus TaxID=6941 RepID=A0A6M2CJC3_RHIMP
MSVVVDGSGDARMQEYSKLAADLEQQELEANNGVASPQAYGQLLAIYLLQNDLPNAKFLWKRIPQEIKQSQQSWETSGKLAKVYGSKIFLQSTMFYPKNGLTMSNLSCRNLESVNYIAERTRRRALILVAKAYSSISLDDASCFLGIPSSV